jgi:tryptophan synthase alpha chain
LKEQKRAGLVTFLTAGDPNMDAFEKLLPAMARGGADLIEVGMPFSDPMADGPAIQAAGLRALHAGTKTKHIIAAIERFRRTDVQTPIVLMGYYNPIYRYGGEQFARDAASAGVDGLIIVDLPPEEAGELTPSLKTNGLDLIRLTAPTSDDHRLPTVVGDASGFIYHVAIAGVTGTRSADVGDVRGAVERIRRHTALPVAVGFGLRTPDQAAAIAEIADAAVVGTALVETVARLGTSPDLPAAIEAQISALSAGVRGARSC